MIDSIVMYPLDVMPLELGLNVLGLSSPELLFKFVEGLQGFGDDVVLGDGSKTAVLTKSILYVGDCADIVDYNALLNICSFQGHCYCRRRPIALFDDYCGSRPPLLRIKATGC